MFKQSKTALKGPIFADPSLRKSNLIIESINQNTRSKIFKKNANKGTERASSQQLSNPNDHEENALIPRKRRQGRSPSVGLSFQRIKLKKRGDSKNKETITDIATWVRQRSLPSNSKIFIISKNYRCIRDAFLERGWVENEDQDSNCFHFKFMLKCAKIKHSKLESWQFVNHFKGGTSLTTKVGLTKTLKSLSYYESTSSEPFYPRCFDCNHEEDFKEFILYFKQICAEVILKRLLDLAARGKRDCHRYQNLLLCLDTAISVSKRRCLTLDKHLELEGETDKISDAEWQIISKGISGKSFDDSTIPDKIYLPRLFKKKNQKKKKKIRSKTLVSIPFSTPRDTTPDIGNRGIELTEKEIEAKEMLDELIDFLPQTQINGMANVWILKPSGLSRGRGIELSNDLSEIVQKLKSSGIGWVVQKYIENPLLYKSKKLDIRQWVLVTSFNPLTIFIYNRFYVRLSSNEYSLDDIKDRFAHLTNNSVNKKATNFKSEDGFLSQSEFKDYLEENFGANHFKQIKSQIKDQVKKSLSSAQDLIQNRKNTGEIFGFDFCIDSNFGVWLIEINSSPDFSFSSKVTQQLVIDASEDYVKVMVDNGKKNGKFGGWKLAYKAENLNEIRRGMQLDGTKIEHSKLAKYSRREDAEFFEKGEI